jgi:hypothetical protein
MERTIISFTTIPERINIIPNLLDSLKKQTIEASVVYIQVPKKTMKGKLYDMDALKRVIKPYTDINVVINIVDVDEGPITKLVPVFDLEGDPNTNIILVDDDVHYSNNMVKKLLQYKHLKAVGFAGRNFNYKSGKLNYSINLSGIHKVDFLETFNSVLYKRELFPTTSREFSQWLNGLPKVCRFGDDICISAWLDRIGQPRYHLPIWYLNVKHDAKGTPELSTENLKGRNEEIFLILRNMNYFSLPSKEDNDLNFSTYGFELHFDYTTIYKIIILLAIICLLILIIYGDT